ncbi:MAG TPA: hypothetical protein VFX49_01875 [Chloroflexota bacterium]|nr:hypothetical protein [Chloroflexota bacterium]
MRATERVTRLTAKLTALGQAADEALAELTALAAEEAARGGREATHWIPGLKETIQRIQLDCADARYAARELRDALPGSEALQPRLL